MMVATSIVFKHNRRMRVLLLTMLPLQVVWRVAVTRPITFDGRWAVQVSSPGSGMTNEDVGRPGMQSTAVYDLDVRHHSPEVRISALRDMETDDGFVYTVNTRDASQRLYKQLLAASTPEGQGDMKYSLVRLGVIEVAEDSSTVSCHLVGGNSWWCRGLDVHYVELKRVKIPWQCERLLWMAQKNGSESPIGKLPPVGIAMHDGKEKKHCASSLGKLR